MKGSDPFSHPLPSSTYSAPVPPSFRRALQNA